jgi:hypothetical protein
MDEQIKQFEPGFTLGERNQINKRTGVLLLPLMDRNSRFVVAIVEV